MNDESNRVNGHRPVGLLHLLHPSLKSADLPALDDLSFDVDDIIARVVQVNAETMPDALTAQMLGNEREGSGIVIDDDGIILTIGYVILEAAEVTVTTDTGIVSPAEVVGYDYESGFGLVPLPQFRIGRAEVIAGVEVVGILLEDLRTALHLMLVEGRPVVGEGAEDDVHQAALDLDFVVP